MRLSDSKRYERLLERYRNGDLDRRTFLGLIGAAGLAAGVTGGPMGVFVRHAKAAKVESVRFDGWGGIIQDAFRNYGFKPYEEATGTKVVEGTFGGSDEFFTLVKSSPLGTYNVYHASGVFDYVRYIDAGYGVVLNEDNIPNLTLVMDALIKPHRAITPEGLSAAPYDYGVTALAYNTKYIGDDYAQKMGAKMLLDPQWKGKIGAENDWRTAIWFGALQTDQDPNDIKDIDAVWDVIRQRRELILKYWGSGAELMSLLAEEEIYCTEAWSGRIAGLQEQGHPIALLIPKNSYGWMESLFVIKGSPVEACEELLNFLLEPEVSIAVAIGQNYPPSLDSTKVDLPEEVEKLPAFDPTGTLASLTFAKPYYWNGREADWAKMFQRIQKGF